MARLDPLAAFTLRRIEARGWFVSAHFINDTAEFHATSAINNLLPESHIARGDDGDAPSHQRRAAALLAKAIAIEGLTAPLPRR
jgi:hypothetical protein